MKEKNIEVAVEVANLASYDGESSNEASRVLVIPSMSIVDEESVNYAVCNDEVNLEAGEVNRNMQVDDNEVAEFACEIVEEVDETNEE